MKCSEHPRTSRKVGKLKNTERELWNQTLLSLCNTMVDPGADIPKGILWVFLIMFAQATYSNTICYSVFGKQILWKSL